MSYTQEQWERVARYLDGHALELTDVEMALAGELKGEEALVEPALDMTAPSESSSRAMSRLQNAAIRLGKKLRLRRAVLTGYSLAAAAAILLAMVGMWFNAPKAIPGPDQSLAVAYVPTDVLVKFVQIPETNKNFLDEVDLLGGQIDLELADVVVDDTPTAPIDNQMDTLDETIRQFWDETPGTQMIQL